MADGKPGAPKAIIDWNVVDGLLISGCSGAEVAAHLGINKATIYDRAVMDHGIPFSEYSQQKKSKGNALIKSHRLAKALGKTDKGDNTLLIWLSKVRLGEKEPKHDEASSPQNITYNVNYSNDTDNPVEILPKTLPAEGNDCPE